MTRHLIEEAIRKVLRFRWEDEDYDVAVDDLADLFNELLKERTPVTYRHEVLSQTKGHTFHIYSPNSTYELRPHESLVRSIPLYE